MFVDVSTADVVNMVPHLPQDAENRGEVGIQLIVTSVTLHRVSHDMVRNQLSLNWHETIDENKKPV
jgi:hypothetical protein